MVTHRTLYRQPGLYCAFPSLATSPDKLFLAFRAAPAPNQRTHIDTRSRCVVCSFKDLDGPLDTCTILKEDHYRGIQDPSIAYYDDRLFLNYFVYVSTVKWHTKSRVKNVGIQVKASSDGGLSWYDYGSIPGEVAVSEPIVFVNGVFMMTIYRPEDRNEVSDLFYKMLGPWKFLSRIAGQPGKNFQEPALLNLGDQLLCVHRVYDEKVGYSMLWVNRSVEGGLGWTDLAPLWPGVSPSLCRLPDGHVVLSYAHRLDKPYRVCARVSQDNSVTWGDEIVLRETDGSPDIGYPSTVVWNGGLVTAYYWHDKADPVRRIEGTRWMV